MDHLIGWVSPLTCPGNERMPRAVSIPCSCPSFIMKILGKVSFLPGKFLIGLAAWDTVASGLQVQLARSLWKCILCLMYLRRTDEKEPWTHTTFAFLPFICQPCRTGLRLEIDRHCVLRRITIFHKQQLERLPRRLLSYNCHVSGLLRGCNSKRASTAWWMGCF